MLFSKEWFLNRQKFLLWFCNTLLVRIWFRWILRINGNRSGIGNKKIDLILPNGIFRKINKKKVWFEFRTHDKFAKRLYYAFKPLWQIIHVWDMLFANNFKPNWNLGFDAFPGEPLFPAAGAVSPVDGLVNRSGVNEIFTTIRAGAGTGARVSTANDNASYLEATTTTNQFAELGRGIYCFDASAIPDDATIDTAILSLWGRTKTTGLGSPTVDIVGSTPANTDNLVAADYGQVQFTTFGNITAANWDGSDTIYNDTTLNADGRNNVSKTGISKFACTSSWDIDNSFGGAWSSAATTSFNTNTADTAGTTKDPKLTGTYTPALNDDFAIWL